LLSDETVGLEIRSKTTVRFRDAEGEQSCRVQVSIVIDWERSLTVVPGRARREALYCKRVGAVHQGLLVRGWSQIHG
jgi:hypothetical protein